MSEGYLRFPESCVPDTPNAPRDKTKVYATPLPLYEYVAGGESKNFFYVSSEHHANIKAFVEALKKTVNFKSQEQYLANIKNKLEGVPGINALDATSFLNGLQATNGNLEFSKKFLPEDVLGPAIVSTNDVLLETFKDFKDQVMSTAVYTDERVN